MSSTKTWIKLRFWCFTGLLVCLYASYVETMAENNPAYEAFCNINPGVSCTSVFTSPYGRGFGLMPEILGVRPPPNGYIGTLFFIFAIFTIYYQDKFMFGIFIFFGFVANILSIYLGYLLFFVLYEICVVCLFSYLTNYFILTYALQFFREKWIDLPEEENPDNTKNE